MECEAESVAYVLAGLVGHDTSTYGVGYIATWTKGDVDTVRATAEHVLRAVRDLTPAIIATVTQDNDHDNDALVAA